MNDMDASLLQDFLTESSELIEQLDQDLVTLESAPESEQGDICNSCFRALHTIKGAAGFLGLEPVIEFAHAAEDALNRLRRGEVAVSAQVMDLLLQSADVVRGQIEQLAAGESPSPADPALIAALNAIGSDDAGADASASTDDAQETDASSENDAEPGEPLELGPQKMDLIEFMVTDLQDYSAQLTDTIRQVTNDATRSEAAEQLGEIADNMVKTADFFELDDLTAVTQLMFEVAPKLNDLSSELVAEIEVRLRAAKWIIDKQAEALGKLRVLSWPLETFLQRLSQLADGEPLDADFATKHGGEVEQLLILDGIVDEPAAAEVLDDIAGKIEPAESETPAPPQANEPAAPAAPQAAPKAAKEPGPKTAAQVEQTIRVEVGRLESLLNLVGQLVLNKNRVVALSRTVGEAGIEQELSESFAEAAGDLDRLTSELQVGVMRTRMQPLAKLFDRYPRVIRDIARHTDKKINLEIVGKDTEVDKSVLELLADPLVHILRNSADHGIELPTTRADNGKTEEGTISLSAEHQGSHVRVAITDDGKGLSRQVIGGKAIEKGLVTPEALANLADEEVFRFIFEAGFSTAAQVSDLSGRGVGMDVVRTNISKLNGAINIMSTEGQGTTIEILIPLTVAIMPAMMIESDSDQYAIPLQSIVEIIRPEDASISSIQGQQVVRLRDSVLPLIDLRDRLGQPPLPPEQRFAVVVKVGAQQIGLVVDGLIGQQEIVIKPLEDGYTEGGPFSGATIREDGRVCLILDVIQLIKTPCGTPQPHGDRAAA
ncbi:chemotaxis protein CheA [Algisphaera agarilytica]|uniref:histidine kinase n=1 Tax=Algisphaera agarilytica TaxID=1385975 RepID=A0A7X0H5V6_9BACT|nr:chemotaxis protein CheA [Algisphaera agarilytica]MBB6429799.1 two-component system chemotaxis sensor kinase CheA [Algisphaera agarilytica]